MDNNCEVVGWVLMDDAARVLVREENGNNAEPTLSAREAFEHFAIQTGTFHRQRIIDSVTQLALVGELD